MGFNAYPQSDGIAIIFHSIQIIHKNKANFFFKMSVKLLIVLVAVVAANKLGNCLVNVTTQNFIYTDFVSCS